ncbi:MAG: GreA/GreB family elongation factor [Bacteroidales bacterium]|nr:GreA/GreB family elongation factor [Bacteroidales bacterium]MBQ6101228.1 GreA/GreB family elongation factor [Bacteroidales bacterium]
MSRGFIKEGDQEEIPMVPPRAYLPEGTPNYVTKEGLAALNEELKSLETELAKAGDNYIMSNFIEAKMKLLISRINSAVEIDLSKANKDTVSFGAWVRYNGRVVRIVGVDEADINQGLLSFTSPLAKFLTGKKVGETFELKGPRGTEKITVEEVSFEPMTLTQMVSDKPSPKLPKEPVSAVKKAPVQVNQTQQETRKNNTDVPTSSDGPHRFEPEVNVMEFLPIVNERGNIMGRALYVELHNGNKMLHPVAHLHVINSKGETTRRYWWHVAFGDTPEKTLQRKMAEVLGLSSVKPKLKRSYIRESKTEKELVYVFTVVSEKNLPETPDRKDYLELFAKDN